MADQVAHPESANPAPDGLETVRQFVNTLDLEQHEPEKLAAPADLAQWLRDHGLVAGRVEAKQSELKRAHDLREALRRLLLVNNGLDLETGDAVDVVNRAAARAKVGVAFEADGCR